MTNKEKYIKFCSKVYVPIFSKPWWMDTVCGSDSWDVFLVEKGNSILAAMPYYITERNNQRLITKAPLTQNNGIIINYPPEQKYCTRLDYEEEIINQVCDFIETLDMAKYEQQYHYSFTNWLPFFWRRYSEIMRYTYVIENTSSMNDVESNFDSKIRNELRKAQRAVHICNNIDTQKFYEINKLSFERQERDIPYSYDFFVNLHEACTQNNCGKMLFAIDGQQNIHSVAYLVWDEKSVYYLLNGTDPQYKSSQANALLVYESIKFASELKRQFDFEGSVIKPIERAFRAYGGVQKPYFRIYKEF
jgi:hypothetical protein